MNANRKSTPRGQMTRGSGNTGPAVMLMPPDIRSIFMPNPPLQPVPQTTYRRKQKWTGVANFTAAFEKSPPPERIILPTPKSLKEQRKQLKYEKYKKEYLEPKISAYRKEQKECGGEYDGMNCYNTLFIGRLAYEVTERKLLREMETFGPVKDIRILFDKQTKKSRGYAFVEFEQEDDMKRAYRAADGMRIEGREIVVDVERGHTVPTWLPRKLGGGLGGTRLGGPEFNVTRPGRFDPSRPDAGKVPPMMINSMGMPPPMMGMEGGGGVGRGGGMMGQYGPPPPGGPSPYGPPPGGFWDGPPGAGPPRGWDGPPPPPMGRGPPMGDHRHRDRERDRDRDRGSHRGGGGDGRDSYRNKRQRSRSPEPRYGGSGGGSRRR